MGNKKAIFKRGNRRAFSVTEQATGHKSRPGGPDARDKEKITVNGMNFNNVRRVQRVL